MPQRQPAAIAALLVGSALAALPAIAGAQPPSDGYVASTDFPIRVHYTGSASAADAEETLGYAEAAWQLQVEQMGFAPPATHDGSGIVDELWIYLYPGSSTSHIEPIGDNPSTPWTDCTSRVVIAQLSPSSFLEMFTAYGLNVASEYATDCGESPFAFQQTGVAVTVLRWPEDSTFRNRALPAFQSFPHHGLDCRFPYDYDKYFYTAGSSLFQVFLEEAYGNYDGALLASIWQAAKQDGSVVVPGAQLDVPNDPNIFDAMQSVLGGPTVEQTFVEFARWRYFVGARDDGAHFRHGDKWTGAELAMDTTLALDALPVHRASPNNLPNELGTVYLELALDGAQPGHGLRFAFDGDAALDWHVDALLIRADHSAVLQSLVLDETSSGETALAGLADYARVVFAVSNLGAGDHDPDRPDCAAGASFAYDLELGVVPTIVGVDPRELEVGTTHLVWITGQDFAAGLDVQWSGTGIDVTRLDLVDEGRMGADLVVAADAQLGPRELTVTNPTGLSASLPEAVVLVAPSGDSARSSGDPDDSGCSCSFPGGASRVRPLWIALLGFLLLPTIRRAWWRSCRGSRHSATLATP